MYLAYYKVKTDELLLFQIYLKSLVILLNMRVSVHFGYAENESGTQLRSHDKSELGCKYNISVI